MRKRPFWRVSVVLGTFLALGCALEKKEESRSGSAPAIREEEARDRRGREKTAGKEKKLPEPWQISPPGRGYYSFPAWSPDGKKVAYTAYQERRQDIWVVEVDEYGRPQGTPVNITNSAGMDEHPSWSPDGTRLVFHSDREEGKRKLFIVDADGRNPELLYQHQTERGLSESFHPSWSPAGGKIAFVAENNIWVIDEEGKEMPSLVTSFGFNDHPSWSPDGDRLAFYKGGAIYVIKADGTDERRLTGSGGMRSDFPEWSGYPSWSPDGESLAFVSNKKKTWRGREIEYYDLWLVKDDGTGEAKYLTNDKYRESSPAWSPRGDKLIFQSNRKDGFHIWAVSLPQ